MATVKEFKEWLNRFPDDTIVEVGFQERGGNYESFGCVNFKTLTLTDSDDSNVGDGWEFRDFRNNQHVKETDVFFGKTYLELGESC